jgi:hypothetical protein
MMSTRCWGDQFGLIDGCRMQATTDVMLCEQHFDEIIGASCYTVDNATSKGDSQDE